MTKPTEKEIIAIIGTGDLAKSFGRRFARLGYPVVYGSRNPESATAKSAVDNTGHDAIAMSQKDAARKGHVVFLPITWPAMQTAAQSLGNLDGKIVVDPSVPWRQGKDGYPEISVVPSSAELIQQWNPGAKVVKAFGTMGSMIIDNPMTVDGPVTIPIASNFNDAKERVARFIVELGLDPVDLGPLRMARSVESLAMIYMVPLIRRDSTEWEFVFRRNADWVHKWQDDWGDPVVDAEHLAKMPSILGYTAIVLTPGPFVMKQIFTISAVLAVFAVASVGFLYIFDILSYENAMSNLLKVVAAIALLGGCSALISFLMSSKKEPPT